MPLSRRNFLTRGSLAVAALSFAPLGLETEAKQAARLGNLLLANMTIGQRCGGSSISLRTTFISGCST